MSVGRKEIRSNDLVQKSSAFKIQSGGGGGVTRAKRQSVKKTKLNIRGIVHPGSQMEKKSI